jgi:hypothetical protein
METYSETMNDRSAGRIVGAPPGPRKVKKKKKTDPTANAEPQPCKVEPNNNKQQPTNQ